MKGIKTIILALVVSLSANFSFGQLSVNKKNKSYFEVLAGFNYAFPKVTDRYTVLSAGALTDPTTLD